MPRDEDELDDAGKRVADEDGPNARGLCRGGFEERCKEGHEEKAQCHAQGTLQKFVAFHLPRPIACCIMTFKEKALALEKDWSQIVSLLDLILKPRNEHGDDVPHDKAAV